MTKNQVSSQESSLNRHRSHCSICKHAQREEIEREFISWKSPRAIVTDFGLRDRFGLFRHAHAMNLFSKRGRNLQIALGRYIERIDDAPATGGAMVQAIGLYAKINSRGELVERDDLLDIEKLIANMSNDELRNLADNAIVPSWFARVTGSNGPQGGDENE
jgi:hypothetical protein